MFQIKKLDFISFMSVGDESSSGESESPYICRPGLIERDMFTNHLLYIGTERDIFTYHCRNIARQV